MTTDPKPDLVDVLRVQITAVYKRGVPHAADLIEYPEARPLLDTLSPPDGQASERQRARAALRMLHLAVDALGGPRGDAAAAMLDFGAAHVRVTSITARKNAAGAHLGISGDWFSRDYLRTITHALAMELDAQIQRRAGRTNSQPYRPHDPSVLPPPPPASSYRPAAAPDRKHKPEQ
jgi:hypothetical protein